FGDPRLAWSFNRDGEAKPGFVEQRDKRMDIDSKEIRKERKVLLPMAHPPRGSGCHQMEVLNSSMSHSWPVSDAAIGTFAYTLECLMGFMGSPSRWRTMSWMVTLFGILVIPLGLVSIFLVISQPLVVGAWCTLCLATAIIMLPMIPLEVDEVIAMSQHLIQRKRRGDSFWTTFWKG